VLHPKCRAYIDDIHIPNTFYTITNNNKHIYIEEIWIDQFGVNPTGNTLTRKRKIALTEGYYDIQTVANQLAIALKTNSFFPGIAAGTDDYNVIPEYATGKLVIWLLGTATNNVKIWSRSYIKANKHLWVETVTPAGSYVPQVGTYAENDDCYDAIGFDYDATAPVSVGVGLPAAGNRHVSVLPFHNLYLTCAYGLGSNEDCIGARGGNILRSIPVDVGFGNMIHDQLQNPFDFIQLEAGQLRSFSFALRDMFQRDVDLHHHFSFSILLVEED